MRFGVYSCCLFQANVFRLHRPYHGRPCIIPEAMNENKPREIPEEDWAQTPPTVRAFVSQSVSQIEHLEAQLHAAQPDGNASVAAIGMAEVSHHPAIKVS